MAYPPHAQVNGNKESSGANQSSAGFLSFIKKIKRFLSKTKKQVVTLEAKRDINRLEHQRSRERSELLSQRRYYENLLRRPDSPTPDLEIEVENKLPAKTIPEIEEKKLISKIDQLGLVKPVAPVIEKTKNELPVSKPVSPQPKPIVNSQDIFPSNNKTELKPAPLPPLKSSVSSFSFQQPEKPKSQNDLVKKIIFKEGFLKKISHFFGGGSLARKLAEERERELAAKTKTEVEGRFWQSYDGVKANLIKDQVVLFFNWKQKILTLSLSLILCCLAISLAYVGLLIWQKERLNDNKTTLANFDAINTEVTKNENDIKEISAFNTKLNIVSHLLSNHTYWTNLLTFLEDKTLKDIYYTKFSGDLSGKYKIPSVGKSLDAVSLQLEVMKAYNMMKSVQYSSAQSNPSAQGGATVVNFNLEMSLDPKIFLK